MFSSACSHILSNCVLHLRWKTKFHTHTTGKIIVQFSATFSLIFSVISYNYLLTNFDVKCRLNLAINWGINFCLSLSLASAIWKSLKNF
jgi:hypothetical protein